MTHTDSSEMLIKRLKAVLMKQRLVLFASGLLLSISVMVLAGIGLSLLAGAVILPVWLKVLLLGAAGAVTVTLFAKYAVARLLDGSIDRVAVNLEQLNPDLKGRLVAAVQFARMKTTPGYSAELLEATEHQAVARARRVDFSDAMTFRSLWKYGRLFLLASVVAVALVMVMPGLFSYSYEVYSNPTTVVAPPLGYAVVPFPGSGEWVKYRDVEVGASIFGEDLPDEAIIYHRLAGGNWQPTKVNLRQARWVAGHNGDSVVCSITLRQINRSFDFYVEAGRTKTAVQRIDVVDRPRVTGIKLQLFYPEYTGLSPTVIDENNGSFSAVVGTRVNINVETNLPVVQGALIFDDSSRQALEVGPRSLETSLQVDKSRSYHIRLRDHLGEENPDPIEFYVTAVPDEYPSIDVLRPGFDVNLSDEMILPLKVRIFDDYGFSSLVLKYRQMTRRGPSDETVAVLHFSDRIKTEGDVEFNWDLDQLQLFPGEYVVYHLEVADNDRISGPKVTRSRQYVARLPSLDEIIAQVEGESYQRMGRTERLLQQGRDLAERFQHMARKLEAQDYDAVKRDWQHQKELEGLVEQNAELIENIEKMAERMDESLDKLAEDAVMSRQVMEKMQQIQKLFEEVATEDMKEAQRKLMEALQKMSQQQLEDAMKNFQLSQEELLQRLERTLALLKRMQVEQKMEAMLRQAEQLLEQQRGLNDETDSTDENSLSSLSPREQELEKQLAALKEDVGELRDLLKEAEMQAAQEAQKFARAVEETDADQNMQKMSQALQQCQRGKASCEGEAAAGKLAGMLDEMQQQFMAMTGGDEDELQKAMRMAIEDANYLSHDQEQMLQQAAALAPRSIERRQMATEQHDLASACQGLRNRIAELGKQTPFIAAELEMLINEAVANMDQATAGFAEAKGHRAIRAQRRAMVDLNKASLRLMESLQNQKQCQKGGNCNKNIPKLESMCNKQNQLNQKTQGMCNNPSSNPSAEGSQAREALQRLASEQQAIRKSMEQLAEEFGNSRQILGRLDDIADEMKLVEEDLADGEVGEKTTERQLRIFSRMLQATRSLQRKDFTEQRKANSATEQPFVVPPELPAELLNDRVKLEDRLRKYLGDGYPPQYEEQIKAYFKALLQTEAQTPGPIPAPGVTP